MRIALKSTAVMPRNGPFGSTSQLKTGQKIKKIAWDSLLCRTGNFCAEHGIQFRRTKQWNPYEYPTGLTPSTCKRRHRRRTARRVPRPAIILQRRACWIGLIAIEQKQLQISVPELRATGRSDICLAKPSGTYHGRSWNRRIKRRKLRGRTASLGSSFYCDATRSHDKLLTCRYISAPSPKGRNVLSSGQPRRLDKKPFNFPVIGEPDRANRQWRLNYRHELTKRLRG